MDPTPPTRPEPINVAPAARQYLDALASLGLLEGDPGSQNLADGVGPVLAALHHVLGGGRVNVEIVGEGTASVVEDLDGLLARAVDETNQLNQAFDAGWARF